MNKVLTGIAVFVSVIMLSACATTGKVPITVSKTVVIEPPTSLYNCPQPSLPSTADLKNKDVGTLISQFYQANRTCKISENNIAAYIANAKRLYATK